MKKSIFFFCAFIFIFCCGSFTFENRVAVFKPIPMKTDTSKTIFWVICNDYVLQWYFDSDSTIAGGDTIVTKRETLDICKENECMGLTYCSIFGKPALYFSYHENGQCLAAYDTTSIKRQKVDNEGNFINLGGFGNSAYFMSNEDRSIWRCGTNAKATKLIAFESGSGFGVADLAVDSLERVWAFATAPGHFSDAGLKLACISKAGKVVRLFDVEGVSPGNAYGTMLVNGKLYIGIGRQNKHHPNSLVELVLDGNGKLSPGHIIPFKFDAHDLASKFPSVPDFDSK
jgi:hypothetical protein